MLKKQQKRWSEEDLISFKDRWRAVTIPVNIKLDFRQTALPLENVLSIIQSSEKVAVTDCVCRTTLQNCDFPQKVCLSLDQYATKRVAEEKAEFISRSEAEKIVLETHQKGLVHLALHRPGEDEKNIHVICSCCSCCCHALQGLLLMNMKRLVKPSKYVVTHDPGKCISCGDCVDRCQFKARKFGEGDMMVVDLERCFGCGLCVTICDQDAIEMVERA